MRRYTVRINDTDHVLDVEELAHDTFTVHLADGRLVDVVLTDHQDLAQAVITPQLEVPQPHSTGTAPTLADRPVPPAAVGTARSTVPRGGAAAMTAPMPGVVLSVEVAPGASVSRGQTLLVLEAMKMKNDLKADRDGVVAGVHVSAGDQVRHGDLLLEFEA